MLTREQVNGILEILNLEKSASGEVIQEQFLNRCKDSLSRVFKQDSAIEQAFDSVFDNQSAKILSRLALSSALWSSLQAQKNDKLFFDANESSIAINPFLNKNVGEDRSYILYYQNGMCGGYGRWKDLSEEDATIKEKKYKKLALKKVAREKEESLVKREQIILDAKKQVATIHHNLEHTLGTLISLTALLNVEDEYEDEDIEVED